MLRVNLLLLALIMIVGAGFTLPNTVRTASTPTWQGHIDGVPTWVTVISRGHSIPLEVQRNSSWQDWGNSTTDGYIFAFGRPDNVRLIVDFATTLDGSPEARIYVDDLGRVPLQYRLVGQDLIVLSNGGFPYITMQALGGDWVVDESVNYNLKLFIDGPSTFPREDFGYSEAPTDGIPDIALQVGGTKGGVLDWSTMQVINDLRPGWGYSRFAGVRRMVDAPPFRVAAPLLPSFPYLGIENRNAPWLDENPHQLRFNLSRSQLELWFVPGFLTGGTYAISSFAAPPEVNFESPFAYYSFDQSTRQPQLVVRADYWSPGSRETFLAPNRSFTSFRYSWKTIDERLYTYSLQVAGTEPYTREVIIGDETVRGIPPEDLPRTVTTTPWPAITFVEAEAGFQGEGIYFYSTQRGDQLWPWLIGRSQQPPSYLAKPDLQFDTVLRSNGPMALPLNMRGEYHSAYFRAPMLYLSPLDGRLHLSGAEGGIWNLGDGTIVRTSAREGGPYIDTWIRERLLDEPANNTQTDDQSAELISQLHAFDDHALYSDMSQVRLWATNASLAEFELAPPHDQASWESFVARVEPYRQQAPDAMAMANWADRLAELLITIQGAHVEIVNQDSDPFIFTLVLEPGFRVSGQDPLGVQRLTPGRYLVRYDGRFSIEPLTPPRLRIGPLEAGVGQAARPSALVPDRLSIALHNDGLADSPALTVTVRLSGPDGLQEELTAQQVVRAGEPALLRLPWTPMAPGRWSYEVIAGEGDMAARASGEFVVAPAASAAPAELIAAFGNNPPVLVLGLLGACLLAAAAFSLVLRPRRTE